MGQDIFILLIEDSRSQALRFWLLLSCLGYQVHLADDGKKGWQEACTRIPHLILLDLNLPSMNGFQVLERLKRNHSTADIPVLILSECDCDHEVQRARELGANDYLFKRDFFRQDAAYQLERAISQALPTERKLSSYACPASG
ncbi:MAG: response regulator [Chloroflexaceae bacterium]|nr:response regulator [Chloroflexaceae bacterium]